jgi:hypothetical protein
MALPEHSIMYQTGQAITPEEINRRKQNSKINKDRNPATRHGNSHSIGINNYWTKVENEERLERIKNRLRKKLNNPKGDQTIEEGNQPVKEPIEIYNPTAQEVNPTAQEVNPKKKKKKKK